MPRGQHSVQVLHGTSQYPAATCSKDRPIGPPVGDNGICLAFNIHFPKKNKTALKKPHLLRHLADFTLKFVAQLVHHLHTVVSLKETQKSPKKSPSPSAHQYEPSFGRH